MAPKLYGIKASPPVRAVLMCAKAIDLQIELVEIDIMNAEHLSEEFRKKNPQHTIPVLEDDDGFVVPDSHAIIGYLVAKYGKDDSLYPKNDYKLRATIDHRLHLDSSILFVRILAISRPLFLKGLKPTQEKLDELKEAIGFLERIFVENKTDYIAGNMPTIADFSIVATVTSANAMVPYSDFPNVKAYIERFQKLPYYEANKEGLAISQNFFEALLKA
ncbi:glutathione S-transferase 1-like [Sitophilus oryzae]|uniref:Glutathione S-transferase 1-like n=1 Tax=Sitophilus oryzae TaxID=7048 RepID=A0A6J2Y022_SITOR|nr:glutathione S-transferase 1-like [Sitophilus oryzae]